MAKSVERDLAKRPPTVEKWLKYGTEGESDPLLDDFPKYRSIVKNSLDKVGSLHTAERSRDRNKTSPRRRALFAAEQAATITDDRKNCAPNCELRSERNALLEFLTGVVADSSDDEIEFPHIKTRTSSQVKNELNISNEGNEGEECVLLRHTPLKSPRKWRQELELRSRGIRTIKMPLKTKIVASESPKDCRDTNGDTKCGRLSADLDSPLDSSDSEVSEPDDEDIANVLPESERVSDAIARLSGCAIISSPACKYGRRPETISNSRLTKGFQTPEKREELLSECFILDSPSIKGKRNPADVLMNEGTVISTVVSEDAEAKLCFLLDDNPALRTPAKISVANCRSDYERTKLEVAETVPLMVVSAAEHRDHSRTRLERSECRLALFAGRKTEIVNDGIAVSSTPAIMMNGHDASPKRPPGGSGVPEVVQIVLEAARLKKAENLPESPKKTDNSGSDQNADTADTTVRCEKTDSTDENLNKKAESVETKQVDSVDGNSKTELPDVPDVPDVPDGIVTDNPQEQNTEPSKQTEEKASDTPIVKEYIEDDVVENKADASEIQAREIESEDTNTAEKPVESSKESESLPAQSPQLVEEKPSEEKDDDVKAMETVKETVEESSNANFDTSMNEDAMDLFDLGEQVAEKYAKPLAPNTPVKSSQGIVPPIKLRIKRKVASISSEVVSESETSLIESPAQTSSPVKRGRGRPRKKPRDEDEFVPAGQSPQKVRKHKIVNESSTEEISDIENSQNVSPSQQSSRPKRAAAEKAVREVFEKSFELLEKEAFEFQPEPVLKKKEKQRKSVDNAEEANSPEKKKRGRKPKVKADALDERSFEEGEKRIRKPKVKSDALDEKSFEEGEKRIRKPKVKADALNEKSFEEGEKRIRKPKAKADALHDKSFEEGEKRIRKPKVKPDALEKSFEEIEKEAFEIEKRKKKEEDAKMVLPVPVPVQEEVDANLQYVVGDLVWSKVAGHPWWPSMVSYDPHKGKYTQLKARGVRQFHVQYFGPEPERSWINEKSTMRYLGLDGFDDALMRERREKFKIAPKRMPDWEVAVEEADEALKMTVLERKQNLTFVYEEPNKQRKKASKEKEGKTLKVKAKVPHTPQKRNKCSLGTVEKKLKESPSSELPDPELSDAFDKYVSATLGPLRDANPKLALDELQELLEEGWQKLQPWQRTKYEDPESDEKKKKKKRARKPSSKVRENLDVDDDTVADVEKEEDFQEAADDQVKPAKSRKRKQRESAVGQDDVPETKKAKKEEKRKNESESEKGGDEESSEKKKKRQKSPLTISDEQALEITKLSNSGPNKKESVCAICEKAGTGEMVTCSGQCLESYHVTCLGVTKATENFKCEPCTTGVHSCFVCKETSKDLQKCSVVQCGKFYHEDCVKTFRQTRVHKSFICPLHCCSSCFVDNPSGLKAFKGRLVKCLRCPSAYHTGDFCAGAGSQTVAGFYIVCPKHFRPKRTQTHHAHVNVSWCFQCSKGGTLVCCEGCPAAYHHDCLEEPPSTRSGETWFCPDCMRGREPMYGEIVWVKLGNYRWWPAEICHPKNVPDNVQGIAHQAGEFPVRFYGSRDYYWTHRGRIFQFQEGDKGSGDSTSAPRSFASLFRRAVEEATCAYQMWRKTKTEKEQQASDKKPAPFKFIKSNIPVGNIAVVKPDLSEIAKCECKDDAEHPCGPESDCVNRMLWYECHPTQCPAGVKCENQRFQLRTYPEQSVFKTAKHGWGLRSMADIKKGDFVNEYVGELIDDEECKRRINKAHDDNITNFYMLTIEKDRIIDAGPKGNYSRFMNHSCDPNCETQKWTINGEVRVGLFAKVDVSSGTELTFNYNLECLGDDKTVCECGSDNCSGYLGVRPKPNNTNGQKTTKKKKRRRPKIKDDGHENECYRCGDGGDIIMCDRGNCPKAYHLSCLGLDKMPHGKWDCPWHHCDECGAKADKLCDECPNSFCSAHNDSQRVLDFPNGRTLCTDHEELIEAYRNGKDTPQDSDASSVSSSDLAKTSSTASQEAKDARKSRDSRLGMGPDLLLPKGPVKRTVNALLSSRHQDKFKPVEKKPRGRTSSKKVDLVAKESDSQDDEDESSGIPGYKFKTTARRAMQKIRQPVKRKRTSTGGPGSKAKASKGPKPRKRARLGAGDDNDSDDFPDGDLVIDA